MKPDQGSHLGLVSPRLSVISFEIVTNVFVFPIQDSLEFHSE